MKKITEKEIKQNMASVKDVVGTILLIIGIIVLGFGIYFLFFGTIIGDMLQIIEYNTFSSLLVLLGIYVSLFGLHMLLQKLKRSTKAYILIVVGISIIIFSFSAPRIVASYVYIGEIAYLCFGFSSIGFGAYSLSQSYAPRKNLVYGNVVMMMIILILTLIFA